MTLDTINIQEKQLITFALFAYNQERFIRKAVEGALAQTYEPLEIILSDDCSLDETYNIMQKMTAEYQGPHKIILNRNKINLGIGEHINRVMELSHGELIVVAAGDDISLPHRTTEIYQTWTNSDKKAFSIDSEFEMIDEYGGAVINTYIKKLHQEHQLLLFSKTLVSPVHGCTHVWHRKVFDVFGPLPKITCEDLAIPPRSMLLGSVAHIDKPLVKYRTHRTNIWSSCKKYAVKESIDKEVYYLNDKITICYDIIRCINEYKFSLKDMSPVCELDECISNIRNFREKCTLKLKSLTGYPVIRLYHLLKYASVYGLQRRDLFWILCAISITISRLSLAVREWAKMH